MTRPLASHWLTLLVALALILGAVAQAATLSAPDRGPVHEIVICADGHEAAILVGADGQPLEPDAACPEPGCADCPRPTVEAAAPEAVALADARAPARREASAGRRDLVTHHTAQPSARAPPEKV
jgi:hypothetical protein